MRAPTAAVNRPRVDAFKRVIRQYQELVPADEIARTVAACAASGHADTLMLGVALDRLVDGPTLDVRPAR